MHVTFRKMCVAKLDPCGTPFFNFFFKLPDRTQEKSVLSLLDGGRGHCANVC